MTMKNNNNKCIGLLTLPLAKASLRPLDNLVNIFSDISKGFILVTDNVGYEKYKENCTLNLYLLNYAINDLMMKVPRYIYGQCKALLIVVITRKKVAIWFFLGGQRSIIPILSAKLLNKQAIIIMGGSAIRDSQLSQDKYLNIIKVLAHFCFSLANKIIIYSPHLIKEWNLEPYRNKILIAHRHFLDFTTFTVTTPYTDRRRLIGYIGRLSGEKGVQNFAQALPAILNDSDSNHLHHQELRAFIGGDGQLKESIEASLHKEALTGCVDLPGWISREDLPGYLNQLRLLILPSYTEGLPNIMLEAMACGTPVLATPVGAIPDVIIDGKTGFIMENNSPECIAENVIRALSSPDLERIAENGRQFVEENFTFEKVVENWKRVLQDIE